MVSRFSRAVPSMLLPPSLVNCIALCLPYPILVPMPNPLGPSLQECRQLDPPLPMSPPPRLAGTQVKLAGGSRWAQHYQRAAAVCPTYAPTHYNLGVAAAEAGDSEAALKHYARAVELEPRYAEAHCNVGVIHKAQASGSAHGLLMSYKPHWLLSHSALSWVTVAQQWIFWGSFV